MTIEKKLEGSHLTLAPEGRLDIATASLLQAKLQSSLHGVKTLTLDFSQVTFISSAGLRVILTAQKLMDQRGGMDLLGVNSNVMHIFEITGFSDILTFT